VRLLDRLTVHQRVDETAAKHVAGGRVVSTAATANAGS